MARAVLKAAHAAGVTVVSRLRRDAALWALPAAAAAPRNLGALDGIGVREGVVYVFTTNCALELIDRAFKRPGRIDVVLEFPPPDAALRRQLIERWHADIRGALDMERALAATAEFSFAELEELKNLMIVHFLDEGCWDLEAALRQFEFNRRDLASGWQRPIGFAAFVDGARNGDGAE